jgi:hypothetical protein
LRMASSSLPWQNCRLRADELEQRLEGLMDAEAARATKLFLSSNLLEALPGSVARLTNLRELLLDKNQLVWLCEEVVYLTKLQTLHLSNNPGLPRHLQVTVTDDRTKTQAALREIAGWAAREREAREAAAEEEEREEEARRIGAERVAQLEARVAALRLSLDQRNADAVNIRREKDREISALRAENERLHTTLAVLKAALKDEQKARDEAHEQMMRLFP